MEKLKVLIRHVVKLATIVEGNPKAPFSIATTPRCRGGRYSFPGLLYFTLDPYLIMLSVKQGGIKYHFLSLWYDSTWDWTQVSRAIGEHSRGSLRITKKKKKKKKKKTLQKYLRKWVAFMVKVSLLAANSETDFQSFVLPTCDWEMNPKPRLSSDLDEDVSRELVKCNPGKSTRELVLELNTSQSTTCYHSKKKGKESKLDAWWFGFFV